MTNVYVVDVDYESERIDGGYSTVIHVHGRRETGESVRVCVRGFNPYFYCDAPLQDDGVTVVPGAEAAVLKALREKLHDHGSALRQSKTYYVRKKGDDVRAITLRVDVVRRKPTVGYHLPRDVFKVTCSHPDAVATLRDAIVRRGVAIPADVSRGTGEIPRKAYEASLEYVLRFLVDTSVRCGAWMRVDNAFPDHDASHATSPDLVCSSPSCLHPYDDAEEAALKAQGRLKTRLKCMSFDIACAGRRGLFPNPQCDPVINIACDLTWLDGRSAEEIDKTAECVVFVLGDTAPLSTAAAKSTQQRVFGTERSLLIAFAHFIREEYDPDVLTGYNTPNFDWKYIIDRATVLGVQWEATKFSRNRGHCTRNRAQTRMTKAHGRTDDNEVSIPGRIIFDMLKPIQKYKKLRSYTLDFVSNKYLGERKDDVHHSEITGMWRGPKATPETRARLRDYCKKDAQLPRRLLINLQMLTMYTELARVCRVPINYLTTKGEQIKVFTQLHYKAQQEGYIVDFMTTSGEPYEGATVLTPKRGFYTTPVATLDFASLYPSIMMAHNLCYTTYLAPGQKKPPPSPEKLEEDDAESGDSQEWDEETEYETSPRGHRFLRSDVRKGLLPMILQDLLASRRRAKDLMAAATDPMERAVYDGRQLALKLSANSVYGFTGALAGKLPLQQIAESVTAYGRDMIDLTKATIEEVGPPGTEVVYGDTDSVMIKYPCSIAVGADGKLVDVEAAIAESRAFALAGAAAVNTKFPKPVKLEYEKVFYPWLLVSKKRYVGGYFENPAPVRMYIMAKGIESERRDNCNMLPRLIDKVVECLIDDFSPDRAVEVVRDAVRGVVDGPKNPAQIAHECAVAAAEAVRAVLRGTAAGVTESLVPDDAAANDLATEVFARLVMGFRTDAAGTPGVRTTDEAPRSLSSAWSLAARTATEDVLCVLLPPSPPPAEAAGTDEDAAACATGDVTVATPLVVIAAGEAVESVLRRTTVISDYIMSRKYGKLSSEYKAGATQTHLEVMARMAARRISAAAVAAGDDDDDDDASSVTVDEIAAGYNPYLGDRVEYVLAAPCPAHPEIMNPNKYSEKATRMADRAEDLDWLMAHGCMPDAVYYVEKQMTKPLAKLLKPLVGTKGEAMRRMMQHVRTFSSATRTGFQAKRFSSTFRKEVYGTYDGVGVGRRPLEKPVFTPYSKARAAPKRSEKEEGRKRRFHAAAATPDNQARKRSRTAGTLDAFLGLA